MYKVYDIDDLILPDILDDSVDDESIIEEEIPTETPSIPLPDPNIMSDLNPMNSSNTKNEFKLSPNINYLKTSNFGNFNALVKLIYMSSLNNKAATFTFSPYTTEYLEIPKDITSIHIVISAIDSSLNEVLIFDKMLTNPKNVYFIIQGTLQAPKVSQDIIKF